MVEKLYWAGKFAGRLSRRAATLGLAIMAAVFFVMPVWAQDADEALRIYAAGVVKATPFRKPFTGLGVYLGRGAVLTAAHVVGRWPFLKDLHVLIAGERLPARLVKQGSPENVDLALLSVDEALLPARLQLRRNPLCKEPPKVGEEVIVTRLDRADHTRIISPLLIPRELQGRYKTLMELVAGSGSGVFDAERRCLMGIVSLKILNFKFRNENGKVSAEPNGYAGYFVPASQIKDFLPPEFQF